MECNVFDLDANKLVYVNKPCVHCVAPMLIVNSDDELIYKARQLLRCTMRLVVLIKFIELYHTIVSSI